MAAGVLLLRVALAGPAAACAMSVLAAHTPRSEPGSAGPPGASASVGELLSSASRAGWSGQLGLDVDEEEVAAMIAGRARFRSELDQLAGGLPDRSQLVSAAAGGHRKKAVHLHVHNSAGSFLCGVAKRHGRELCTKGLQNCNLYRGRFDDSPFTNAAKSNGTCADRRSEMEGQHVTFSMIERWIDRDGGDWCPDDFVYTIIMRDPIARARTTIRLNEHRAEEDVARWLTEDEPDQRHGWLHSYAAYNDLVVRLLNGPEGMLLPRGAPGRAHLELAKRRLREFDAVLTVPSLAGDWAQLVETLGWAPAPNPFDTVPQASTHFQLSSRTLELLQEHNRLDLELYRFAQQLAEEKTTAAVRRLTQARGTAHAGAQPAAA